MKDFKCDKCGEVLVTGEYLKECMDKDLELPDKYEVLSSHIYYCNSKEGRAYTKAVDESDGHNQYCNCEKCV